VLTGAAIHGGEATMNAAFQWTFAACSRAKCPTENALLVDDPSFKLIFDMKLYPSLLP